jgi:midasin
MLNGELQSLSEQADQAAIAIKTSLSKELSVFGSEVQLQTGLGMERVWRHFKPKTPKTLEQLAGILDLERLADRLDAAMWKLNLPIDEMIQIPERFAGSLQLIKSEDIDASELHVVSYCASFGYAYMLTVAESGSCSLRTRGAYRRRRHDGHAVL